MNLRTKTRMLALLDKIEKAETATRTGQSLSFVRRKRSEAMEAYAELRALIQGE